MVFYGTFSLPVTIHSNSPSKLSASTLNPSSLLISKRRCGPVLFGAWFSLSSGNGGSSSELEASPGPKQRVSKDHLFWSQNLPTALPHSLGTSTDSGFKCLVNPTDQTFFLKGLRFLFCRTCWLQEQFHGSLWSVLALQFILWLTQTQSIINTHPSFFCLT